MERGLARTAGGYKTAFGQEESLHFVVSRERSDDPNDQPQQNPLEAIGSFFSGIGRGTLLGAATVTGSKSGLGIPERKGGFFSGIVGADESDSEFEAMMKRRQAALKNAIENDKNGTHSEKIVFTLKNEKEETVERITPRSELHSELLYAHQKMHARQQGGFFGLFANWGVQEPLAAGPAVDSSPSLAMLKLRKVGEQAAAPTGGVAESDRSFLSAGGAPVEAYVPPPPPVAEAEPEPASSSSWQAPSWTAPRVFQTYAGELTKADADLILSPPPKPPPKPTSAQLQQRAMLATPQGWLHAYKTQARADKAAKKGEKPAFEYADAAFRGPTADAEAAAKQAIASRQPKVLQRNPQAAQNDVKQQAEMLSHDDLMKMYTDAAKDAAAGAGKSGSRSKLKLSSLGRKRAPKTPTGARLEDAATTPMKGAAPSAEGAETPGGAAPPTPLINGFGTGEFWFGAASKIDPTQHIDWKDSNVAGIGSDEDKALRKMAAKTEPAWVGCGQTPGVEVWRIEQFKVVPWPKEQYGQFYNADSYIILHTREVEEEAENLYGEDGGPLGKAGLAYAIYFWLGKYTSIDKQGTAAYKTVELDDLMDQAARQHREVMEFESEAFRALFPSMTYLEGGTESGFRSVCDIDLNAYVARLLHVKKYGNSTVVVEVPCKRESLNHGAAFILDKGDLLYAWNGQQSTPVERAFARMAAEELERARAGKAVATSTIDAGFWDTLGGYGPIKSKSEAGEELPQPVALGDGVLYKLSDKTGQLYLTEVHRGSLNVEMLLPSDVYICDPGSEVIVWVGEKASDRERRAAMLTATKYLALQGKPHTTPIKVFKSTADAMTDSSFAQIFAGTAALTA